MKYLITILLISLTLSLTANAQLARIGDTTARVKSLIGYTGTEVSEDGNLWMSAELSLGQFDYQMIYLFKKGKVVAIGIIGTVDAHRFLSVASTRNDVQGLEPDYLRNKMIGYRQLNDQLGLFIYDRDYYDSINEPQKQG